MLKIANALFLAKKQNAGRKTKLIISREPFLKVTLKSRNAKGQLDHMNTFG